MYSPTIIKHILDQKGKRTRAQLILDVEEGIGVSHYNAERVVNNTLYRMRCEHLARPIGGGYWR